jgi:predicted ATPase
VGKTRLALAVAAALAEKYAKGVVFVELAPVRDPRLVPATIARSLEVNASGGQSARELVLAALRDQQRLLVLDNFEHVLDAAPLLTELLAGCQGLRVLATSRAALRLGAERRLVVPPLAAPEVDGTTLDAAAASPAVRLFMERAKAVVSGFVLDPNNAAAVGAICRRLDGLPLAIELAAARVGLLGPAALLRRLERRLPLLTHGDADLPERQQTLRATLAWSYDLLGSGEQQLYRRLAVFAGGWTLEAAEGVCGGGGLPTDEVLDRLQVLVDSSLVHRLDAPTSEPRFGMLETVREFAQEVLEASDEAPAQRRRHATHVLALAEQAEPHLAGADQRTWFDLLDHELDNLRAALAWAQSSGHVELGLRLAGALTTFFEERGHVREGCDWLETLMQAPLESQAAAHLAPLQARALATTAWLKFLQGDYQRAAPLAEESLARWRQLGQPGNSSVALNTLAYVARRDGDLPRQEALFRASLDLCRAQGDTRGSAAVLSWISTQKRAEGDLEGATALLEESLRLYQATCAVGGIAYVLLHLVAWRWRARTPPAPRRSSRRASRCIKAWATAQMWPTRQARWPDRPPRRASSGERAACAATRWRPFATSAIAAAWRKSSGFWGGSPPRTVTPEGRPRLCRMFEAASRDEQGAAGVQSGGPGPGTCPDCGPRGRASSAAVGSPPVRRGQCPT